MDKNKQYHFIEPELQSTLIKATHRLWTLMNAGGASIELLHDHELYCEAGWGDMEPYIGRRLDRMTITDAALKSGTVQFTNEAELPISGISHLNADIKKAGSCWATLVAPIRLDHQAIGLIRVTQPRLHAFTANDIKQIKFAADTLGGIVELHRDTQHTQASTLQYRVLFERSPLPMYVSECDRGQHMLAVNASMLKHYGYNSEEFLRLGADDILFSPDTTVSPGHGNLPCLTSTRARQRHRRKDGVPIDVEIWADTIEFEGRPARLALIYDVTERLQAEAQLTRMSRAQRMLSACNEAQAGAESERALLRRVCEIAVEIGGYTSAFVGYAQQDETKSIEIQAQAGRSNDYVKHLQISWDSESPRGAGPSGQSIRSGKPVVITDVAKSPKAFTLLDQVLAEGNRTVVALPLRNKERVFGTLTLLSPAVSDLSQEETGLLEDLANDLAFGIEHCRAHAEQLRMLEQRERLRAAVMKIAAAVSSTGSEFFAQLAANMIEALGGHAAFVARLDPGNPLRARTVAAVIHGAMHSELDISLVGTPCSNIECTHEWQVTEGIARQFSSTPLPAAVGANAFVARRLDNAEGQPIGLIVVAFCDGLKEAEFTTSTLRIFAARAASEMVREEANTRIRDQASFLDKAQDAILVMDLEGRLQFWNKSAEKLYDWLSSEALGRSYTELLAVDRTVYEESVRTVLSADEFHGEFTRKRKDGLEVMIESRWTLIRDDDGRPKVILSIDNDISARKAAETKIQKLAYFDSLTGLPNRLMFTEHLQAALSAPTRNGGVVILIDLDNFKSLNDTWGHDVGDLLLIEAAARLKSCVGDRGFVARMGGDEFVVLLSALPADPRHIGEQAQALSEKILDRFGAPYLLNRTEFQGRASIGISRFIGRDESVSDLLKQADIALYEAKSSGRNKLRFFDAGLEADISARAELEAELRQALSRNEFVLHYQPQINCHGAVVGVEALVRWRNAQRGLVSPAEFIPLCEENGMILDLGHRVLEMACRVLTSWQRHPSRTSITMAVNVSTKQFLQPEFVSEVRTILQHTGANPMGLKLELTESVLVEKVDAVVEKIAQLNNLGIRLSLDDFGTGYSSLTYLKRLPLDQLKIDQSFVRDILINVKDEAIAKTIISLGHSLGLQVIAEGVEDQAQYEVLASLGCHAYQGYFISRPLPIDELERFIDGCAQDEFFFGNSHPWKKLPHIRNGISPSHNILLGGRHE